MSEDKELINKNIFDDIFAMIADGKPNKAIAKHLTAEYDGTYHHSSPIIKNARTKFVTEYDTPDKQYYFKESLLDYDLIKNETSEIADRKEALKLKLATLRDRNELLGLSKAAINIEINFEGKNYKDEDFLRDHNIVEVEVKDNGKES